MLVPMSSLMTARGAALVLVDYQERLMPAIRDNEKVVEKAGFLATIAREVGVPVLATAQNPSRLGPNVEPVTSRCDAVLEKMHFGACGDGLVEYLAGMESDEPVRNVIVAGCETHVCMLQTALGLLDAGFRVWVVADASGSRRTVDHEMALRRLVQAGATLVTAEMVAFEWMVTCEHDRFKAVSSLVKAVDPPV